MNTSTSTQNQSEFKIGCNYWASHAGTAMWTDWRADIVEKDFELLSKNGLRVLRVFPLWPVFQPIHLLRRCNGLPHEYRFGEAPLPDDVLGQSGVSRPAMEKFEIMADLAEKHELRLMPTLITGWMSGRLFLPPALEGRNVLTDPVSIMWQVRFVKTFVRHFRAHPSIESWVLGNECNCLAAVDSREAAWNWTSAIANAIRTEDPVRSIVSGMHSLSASREGFWSIEDEGELTNVLTVHPYPPFTPHSGRDPINTLRSELHATAEASLYSDIGGQPCLAEEVGTLGPMFASEPIAADYLRTMMYSLLAHSHQGMLWWCAFDQGHLAQAPYDWCACERELGLFRSNAIPKPVVSAISNFSAVLEQLPPLPMRTREAVCILTENQDSWGAAYGSFILAKQAGFDLEFQTASQPIRDSDLYLLPSLSDQPTGRFSQSLMEKVRQGATLYVSLNTALLSNFAEWFGMTIQTRYERVGPAGITFRDNSFAITASYGMTFEPTGAEVLAAEANGQPAFFTHSFGAGRVYFLTVPLELHLITTPGAFDESKAPAWTFYREFAAEILANRIIQSHHPNLGVTEHLLGENKAAAILINYSPEKISVPLALKPGWTIGDSTQEAPEAEIRIGANDAVILFPHHSPKSTPRPKTGASDVPELECSFVSNNGTC